MARRNKRRIARWFAVLLHPYRWPRNARRFAVLLAPLALILWSCALVALATAAILTAFMRPLADFWNAEASAGRDDRVRIATRVRAVPLGEHDSGERAVDRDLVSLRREPTAPLIAAPSRPDRAREDAHCVESRLFEGSGHYALGCGDPNRLN